MRKHAQTQRCIYSYIHTDMILYVLCHDHTYMHPPTHTHTYMHTYINTYIHTCMHYIYTCIQTERKSNDNDDWNSTNSCDSAKLTKSEIACSKTSTTPSDKFAPAQGKAKFRKNKEFNNYVSWNLGKFRDAVTQTQS